MKNNAVEEIATHSGLPTEYAKLRLERLLFQSGFDPDTATIEEIRVVLANLLQDLILEADATDETAG